jgi:hypothetical protein
VVPLEVQREPSLGFGGHAGLGQEPPRVNRGVLCHRRRAAARNSCRYRECPSLFPGRPADRRRHNPNCARAMDPAQIDRAQTAQRCPHFSRRPFQTLAGVWIGICPPMRKLFWRPTVPRDNGNGPEVAATSRPGTPPPPGECVVTEAPGHSPSPPMPFGRGFFLSRSCAAWKIAEGFTCTVQLITADKRRFSRVSLKRSATWKRLPPLESWLPSIGRWRMKANAPLNSNSKFCPGRPAVSTEPKED